MSARSSRLERIAPIHRDLRSASCPRFFDPRNNRVKLHRKSCTGSTAAPQLARTSTLPRSVLSSLTFRLSTVNCRLLPSPLCYFLAYLLHRTSKSITPSHRYQYAALASNHLFPYNLAHV